MALKIMTFDAADLIRYDKKTKQIVPSNLSMYSEIVDKKTGEIIQIKNKRLFRMRQEDSMVLDELMRLIEQNRLKKTAIFKVGFKEATNQIVHVTFKYSKEL